MSRSLRRRSPRRPSPRWCSCVVTALVATGCKFDGAYDLPLPGNKVDPDDAYAVTADFADALNVVPRTAVFANDVPVGQVTEVERVGWHARVKFLVRKDIELPENVADRRTPDQPAGGEVHRPGRAGAGYGERQAALRRRLHPALPHQPQPRGRGGARRALDAAQRRRHRPAQDDQRRAEQHDERTSGQGPAPAGQPRPDDRRPRRPEGRHHRRDGVDRPALRDAGQGEGRHRRGHRQHGPGAEGAQPPAREPDDDAAAARQARRGRHPRAQRQHATTSWPRCATCSPP